MSNTPNTPNERAAVESSPGEDLNSLGRGETIRDSQSRPDTGPSTMPASMTDGTMIQGAATPSVGIISLSAVQVPELPPEFEMIQEIARGGMGVVYKARQKRLNRVVALKMILPQMLYDASAIERFYIEARAAASLDHPNIVPIHEVGEYRGQHYFTMAFIEGESLRHRIKRQRPTIREAVKLLIGIADGVGFAHRVGIIHRDMKPDNVLIDQQGRPRVTDFGLAKQVASNSGLTATGQVMGTPAFMSPEQALGGKRIIGPQTDVYALGAILYNMLTGESPYDGDSVTEVLCKVIADQPPSIRLKNQDIPESLEAIYLKAMAKDAAHRYADAEELRVALVEWESSGEATSTRPDIVSNRTVGNSPLVQNTIFPSQPDVRSMPTINVSSPMLSSQPSLSAPPTQSGKPAWLFPVLGVLFVGIGVGVYLIVSGGSPKEEKKPTELVDTRDKGTEPKPKEAGAITPAEKKVLAEAGKVGPLKQVSELMKAERQDFKLKVEFLTGKADDKGIWKLKKGDLFSCRVTSDKDCHVGVWSVDADGKVTQLFPNDTEMDDRIKAGMTRTIPGDDIEIEAQLTRGEIDQLLVIGSNRPWDPELGGKDGPFTVFKEQHDRDRFKKNVHRGLTLRPKTELVSEEVIQFRVEK